LAIAEGDMILGRADEIKAPPCPQLAGGVPPSRRWPGGVIPFAIAVSDATLRDTISRAIQHWQDVTPIKLIPRNGQADYVQFVQAQAGERCRSPVGRHSGEHQVLLEPGCGFGQVVHEIGHVVGLWHEQGRSDRGCFIDIHEDAISEGRESDFNQFLTDGDAIGFYDYGSVMHYDSGQSARSGAGPTITTRHGEAIGQRTGLSASDARAVWAMYGAPQGQIVSMERTFCPPPGEWWSPGWTAFVPYQVTATDSYEVENYLLLYNANTGALAINLVTWDNQFQEIHHDIWSEGWTFSPFLLDDQPHLFEYKPGDGTMAIDRIGADGVPREVHRDEWPPGWTMTTFQLDGRPYLVRFRPGDGTVAIDRLSARGASQVWGTQWSTGWTITAFQIGGQPYLIEYRPSDGRVGIDRIRADGVPVEIYRDTWSPGWTVTAFEDGNEAYLLLYSFSQGTVRAYNITPNGATTELFFSTWQHGLSVAALNHKYSTRILTYAPTTGEVAIDTPRQIWVSRP